MVDQFCLECGKVVDCQIVSEKKEEHDNKIIVAYVLKCVKNHLITVCFVVDENE